MNNKRANILLLFLLLIVSIFIIINTDIIYSDLSCALFVCSIFVIILICIFATNKVSPFFLFLATYCFLFIGGHFWGVIINSELNLRVASFMSNNISNDIEWKETILYIIIFPFVSSLGYVLYFSQHKNVLPTTILLDDPKIVVPRKFNNLLRIVFLLLTIVIGTQNITKLLSVLSGGYGVLFEGQASEYSGGSFITVLLYFFFAMAMVYGDKRNKKLYLFLMLFDGIIKVIAGGRAAFGSIILFLVWYYFLNHKVSLKKLLLGLILASSILLTFSLNSKRSADSNNEYETFTDVISLFIYSQGETLSTFEACRTINNYPSVAYYQSFIPGASFIYKHFSSKGSNLQNSDTSFSLHLSSELNFKRFLNGDGTGWSILGDLYLFSGRTWSGFVFLSFIFGLLVAYIESKAYTTPLARVILYSIILRFLILPRTGCNYIFPLIAYVVILYYLVGAFFKINITNRN